MSEFEAVARRLNALVPDLVKGLTKGQRAFRNTKRLAEGLADVRKRFNYFSDEISKAKRAQRELKKLNDEFTKVKKSATAVKDTVEKFTEKLPGGNQKEKAAKAGANVAALIGIGGVAVILAIKIKQDEWLNKLRDSQFDQLNQDDFRLLRTLGIVNDRVKANTKDIQQFKLEDQRTRNRIYALEKEQVTTREGISSNKKNINDVTYELRATNTRTITRIDEAKKVGNDALYEVRANSQKNKDAFIVIGRDISDIQGKLRDISSTAQQALTRALKVPEKGDKGDKGLKGDPGTKGKDGTNGINGINGINGQMLTITLPGIPGRDGIDGKNGINGINGKDAPVDKESKELLKRISENAAFIPALVRGSQPLSFDDTVRAAAAGSCQTMQPGGCGDRAIQRNNISQLGGIQDLFNTGANAAQLALLTKIDLKMGAQIAGGLSGKLVDGFKWLHLDRVLNVLTFIATVQNHLMLSNDIGQTLLGAINNGLQLIGIKDDKGAAINVGEIVGNTIENTIKGLVGTENYATLSVQWAKANRIYQASTNILNSFQGLSNSILNGVELVAGQTSKIANALRDGGMVLETAFGYMNPQPKINRITNFLNGLQQGASTVQQVTQVPLDIASQATELTNASTEFIKALKEDDKPENKATVIPEPDKLKADALKAKEDSQPLDFDSNDLYDGED